MGWVLVFGAKLWTNSDYGHHSAGLAELDPMREEALPVTRRATGNDGDMFRMHARDRELMAVRGNQVKVDLGTKIAVSGSTLVQEQQRIFRVNWVRVEYLFE